VPAAATGAAGGGALLGLAAREELGDGDGLEDGDKLAVGLGDGLGEGETLGDSVPLAEGDGLSLAVEPGCSIDAKLAGLTGVTLATSAATTVGAPINPMTASATATPGRRLRPPFAWLSAVANRTRTSRVPVPRPHGLAFNMGAAGRSDSECLFRAILFADIRQSLTRLIPNGERFAHEGRAIRFGSPVYIGSEPGWRWLAWSLRNSSGDAFWCHAKHRDLPCRPTPVIACNDGSSCWGGAEHRCSVMHRRPATRRLHGCGGVAFSSANRQHRGGNAVAVSADKLAGERRLPLVRRRSARLRRGILGVGATTLVVSLIGAIVGLSAIYRVSGLSMYPGLRPGNLVLVDPFTRWLGALRRGDVVTVLPPALPGTMEVKRIIGLPGDQIEIRRPAPGRPLVVYLRPSAAGPWRRLREPYLGSAGLIGCCTSTGRATEDPRPFTVPPGDYFVMGDNRSVSYDSRDYGPVPRSAILGQVVWLVTPWSHFGSTPIS